VIDDPFSHRLDAYELDAGAGRFRALASGPRPRVLELERELARLRRRS